ncbi:Shedu immune nuclease family protein [Limnothrix redekei]|uniref:Shedu immune nuclease family protein n=1 Tax=Limnothrix redekei LRLZ20PSL1 TaxID=3112953 RepID=A0ABW7CA31_9CYAN
MKSGLKKWQLTLDGASPMVLTEEEGEATQQLTSEQVAFVDAVSASIKAYLKATESLSAGQYAHLRDAIPAYLADPGNVLIAICSDGVVVRYERKRDEERRLLFAVLPQSIVTGAAILSQNLVHIASPAVPLPESQEFGADLKLCVISPQQGEPRDVMALRLWFHVENAFPEASNPPGAKPHCLLSVRNQIDLELHGVLLGTDEKLTPEQPFIARSSLRVDVGWDCIEVFPGTDDSNWNPNCAPLWAERDLLGALLIAQTAEAQLSTLDPRASARRAYAKLLTEFKTLLDSNPEREQVLQTFLQSHPILLCPTYARMWPKLPLGSNVTDFVFCTATGEYLLVELERSTLPLFRQDGHPTADLTHAQGQIVDWKRYLEDNLQTVQRELGLTSISASPNGLLVIGRSSSLQPRDRRKLQTMMNESPKLRIMTYDDIYDNARAVLENLLGPMWDSGGTTQIYYPPKTESYPYYSTSRSETTE